MLANILIPPCCIICNDVTKTDCSLCDNCFINLPLAQANFSDKEGRISQIVTLFNYESLIKDFIKNFKYNGKFISAKAFCQRLSDKIYNLHITEKFIMPDLLLPVPLNSQRFIERGYNQAIVIANYLSAYLNIEIDTQSVIRIKATQKQFALKPTLRKTNLKNAFKVINNKKLTAKHVAIVDDIITTKTTINELATVLQKSGVNKISAISLAHA